MNRIGNWLTGCSREQRARQVCRPKAECGLSAHVAGGRCGQFPLVPLALRDRHAFCFAVQAARSVTGTATGTDRVL